MSDSLFVVFASAAHRSIGLVMCCLLSVVVVTGANAQETAQVTVVWNSIPQADGYQLEEMAPGSTAFSVVNAGPESQVMLTDREYGEYRFRVIGCLTIPPATALTCSTQYAKYSDELVTQLNAPILERRVIFLHTDVLGSPAAETDSNGTILNRQSPE